MFQTVLKTLFGCSHRRTTFPLTPARNGVHASARTYVACLDCGQEFAYDWKTMRLGKPVTPRVPVGDTQPSFR